MARQPETEDSAGNVYFLHGWRDDEDEDVNVESSKGSSRDEILPKTVEPDLVGTPVNLSKTLDSAEVSGEEENAEGGEDECDSARIKTRSSHIARKGGLIFSKRKIVIDDKVTEDAGNTQVVPEETSKMKPLSELRQQQKKLNERKRLDARKFRNHFAAKLSRSNISNIEGK